MTLFFVCWGLEEACPSRTQFNIVRSYVTPVITVTFNMEQFRPFSTSRSLSPNILLGILIVIVWVMIRWSLIREYQGS